MTEENLENFDISLREMYYYNINEIDAAKIFHSKINITIIFTAKKAQNFYKLETVINTLTRNQSTLERKKFRCKIFR